MRSKTIAKNKFYSKRENLEAIREFVQKNLEKTFLESNDIFRLQLAVDEACANIISHNYKDKNDKIIIIEINSDDEKVSIIIEDEGDKFNPLNISDPNLKEHLQEYRKGGLGIYLMRKLVDEIVYHYVKRKGNKLELIKYKDVYELC